MEKDGISGDGAAPTNDPVRIKMRAPIGPAILIGEVFDFRDKSAAFTLLM